MKRVVLVFGMILIVGAVFANGKPERFELVSMSAGTAIEGDFFLGSGSIGEEAFFFAYVRHPDGGIEYISSPGRLSRVYETEGEPYAMRSLSQLGFDGYGWTFYVPRGSIIPMFDLALPSAKS